MSNSDQGEGGIIDGDEDIGPPGVEDDMFADNDVVHGVDNDADRDAVHDQQYSADQDDGYDPHDADHDITGSLGAGDMIEGDYNDQDGLVDDQDGGDDMVVVHGGDKGIRRSVSGEDGRRSISAGSVPGSPAGSKGSRPGGSKSRSREKRSKSKDDSRRSSKSKNDSGKKKSRSRSRSRKRSGDKSKDRDRRSSRSSRDVRSSRSSRHATSSTDLRHTIRSNARTSTSGRRDVDIRRSRDTRDLKTGGPSVRRGPPDLRPFPGHRPPGGSFDRRRDVDSRRPVHRGELGHRRGAPHGRLGEDRGRPWPPRDPHAPPHYRDGGRGGRAPYPTRRPPSPRGASSRRPPSPRGAGFRPPSPGRRIGGPPRLPARRAGSADKRPAAYQTVSRHGGGSGRSASPRRKETSPAARRSPAAASGRRSRDGQKPGRDLKDKLFGSSKKEKKGRSSRSSSSSSPEAAKPMSKKRKKGAGESGKPRTHDLTEEMNESPATGLGMKILKEAINSATKDRSKKSVGKSKKKESKTKEKKSKKSAKEGKLKKKIKKEKVEKVEDFIEEISPPHRPPAVVEELEPEPVKMPADHSQDRLGSPLISDHVVMPDRGLIHPISITNPDFRTGKQGLANAKILGKIQIDIKRNISADQIQFNAKIIRTLGDPHRLVIPRKKFEGKEPIFHFREALKAQKDAAAKAAEPPARGPQIRLVAAPLAKYEEKLKDIIVDEDIINPSSHHREPQIPEPRYSSQQQVVPGDARFESVAMHLPIHVDNKHKRHPANPSLGAVERFDVPYTEAISRSNSKEFRSNSQQEFRSNSQQEFRSNSRNGYRSPSREFRGGVEHVDRRGSPKVFRNERDEEMYSPPPPQGRKLKADRTKLQEMPLPENKFRKDTFIAEKRAQSPTLELNDFRLERVREEILAVKNATKYKMEKIRDEKVDMGRRGPDSPARRSSSREGAGSRQEQPRPDSRQRGKPDFKSEDKDRVRDKEREEERFRDKNRDLQTERKDIDLRNDRGQRESRDSRDTRRDVDLRGDRDRKEDKEIRSDRDRSDLRGDMRDHRGDKRDNRGDIRDTNRGKDDIRGKPSHDQNFVPSSHRSRDGEHPGGRFKPGPTHTTDHRFEGGRPDHRSRSPHHHDRRRPHPHSVTDRRGPPPISDRRGPPPIHDRRGPPPIHDRRGPPSGNDHRDGHRGERDSGHGHSTGRGHHDDQRSSHNSSGQRRPSGGERRRGGEEERHRGSGGGRGEEPVEEGRGDVKSRLGDKVVGGGPPQVDVLARLGDRAHSNGKGTGKSFNVKERLGNLSKEKTKPSYIEHDIRVEDKWDGAKGGAGAGLRSESGAWRHDLYSTEEIDISEEPTSTTN